MRDDKERLLDILEAIDAIERYSVKGKQEFISNELIPVWMIRNLQVIGEAANHLSDDTRAQAPEIPWEIVRGMRNFLVHVYFDIDPEIVWQAITNDIDPLKQATTRLLKSYE